MDSNPRSPARETSAPPIRLPVEYWSRVPMHTACTNCCRVVSRCRRPSSHQPTLETSTSASTTWGCSRWAATCEYQAWARRAPSTHLHTTTPRSVAVLHDCPAVGNMKGYNVCINGIYSTIISQSHQTCSYHVLLNGLKLFVNYLNVVQTSWT